MSRSRSHIMLITLAVTVAVTTTAVGVGAQERPDLEDAGLEHPNVVHGESVVIEGDLDLSPPVNLSFARLRLNDPTSGESWSINTIGDEFRFGSFWVFEDDGDVGSGTVDPTAAFHVRRSDGSARVFVQEASGTAASRRLLELENNGPVRMMFNDTTEASGWEVATAGPDLVIAPEASASGRLAVDRFLGDPDETTLTVERNGATEPRKVLRLLNNGPTGFFLSSDEPGNEFTWEFATRPNHHFVISLAESGQPELKLLANGNAELAGTLSENSDRDAKTDVEAVDPAEILALLDGLQVSEWSYLDDPGVRHLGPMAQDFRAVFGLGHSDTSLSSLDAAGVCLAATQGLQAELGAARADIADLEAANAELATRLAELEAAVAALEGS